MERSRTWELTIYDLSWEDRLKDLKEGVNWLVFQRELCPKTNRVHLQCGISWKAVKSWNQMQRMFPGVHIEKAIDAKGLWHYSQKEETRIAEPYVYGTGPAQGKRTDLNEIGERLIGGDEILNVALDYPGQFIRYHKGIEKLWNLVNLKARDEKPRVYWFWGKAGTGKTRKAVEMCNNRYYIKDSSPWWDNYQAQL